MPEVVRKADVYEWVEDYLTYLFAEFEDLPEVAAEWDEWDDYAQLDFVIEWPIRMDRLHQLRQWSEQELLTPEQRRRYDELLHLVEANRPLLEKLLRD